MRRRWTFETKLIRSLRETSVDGKGWVQIEFWMKTENVWDVGIPLSTPT